MTPNHSEEHFGMKKVFYAQIRVGEDRFTNTIVRFPSWQEARAAARRYIKEVREDNRTFDTFRAAMEL